MTRKRVVDVLTDRFIQNKAMQITMQGMDPAQHIGEGQFSLSFRHTNMRTFHTVHTHTHTYVRTCYGYVYTNVHVYICTLVYVSLYTLACIRTYVYMCVCVCVYCMYVCEYITCTNANNDIRKYLLDGDS